MLLYVSSTESDYLQDLTFAGLAEVLGPERLVDFPSRWQYRRERERLWKPRLRYPRNLGLLPESLRGRLPRWSAAAVRRGLQSGDFRALILGAAKPDALAALESIIDRVRVPWILIDGGDRREPGGDFERLGGPDCLARFRALAAQHPPALTFKREWPLGANDASTFPLPFSIRAGSVPQLDPASPKRHQVAFWAVESSETRRRAFRMLADRYDCRQNGSVVGQKFRTYSKREGGYFEALNAARVSLSFRGEGFDTLRYWEIPACGSLLLSERPEIQIPNDFTDGKNALFCRNDLSDLIEKIDWALAHPDEALQIAREGQRHAFQHHTHLKRAEYVLDILEKRLGLRWV